MNMNIWVVSTSNKLFIRGSSIDIQKNKVVTVKISFFMLRPFFTPCSICSDIGF